MNKEKLNKILMELLFPLSAFIICLVLLLVIYSANGFALFNHDGLTIIAFDMQSEYVAYLRYLKTMLTTHGGIDVYTFGKVFGGDFLSIYTFYLASPFNYLVAFVNDVDIPLFFLWTTIIKMAIASLGMYLLLRYVSGKYDFAYIGFAIAYGMVSYSFIYSSNYMWIDGVMALPFVILGLHMIENKHNPIVYVLALAYSLASGWYIGALSAMFTAFYFVTRFIASNESWKERLFYLLRFGIFSLVGGLISSTNWLVAFSHFDGTKATDSLPPLRILDFSMFFTGAMENGYSDHSSITLYSGYMPLFISIAVIALAVMFFFNKGYSLKVRLSYLGLVIFYYFVSLTTTTNALMHGGREPTWFPARYAFVISFFFCYLGALQFIKKEETPIWGILSPLGFLAIALPIALLIPNSSLKTADKSYHLSIVSLLIYIFVTLFMLIDYFFKKKKGNVELEKIALSLGVTVLTIISAYRGANNIISVNKKGNVYQQYQTYLEDNEYSQYIENSYDESYRVATLFNRPGNYNQIDNNPMFYGFDGLSNFSSSSKKDVESYMAKVGFHYNWFFSKYENGSTASINSLLGVKYIYDQDNARYHCPNYFKDNYPFTSETIKDSNIVRYENTLALPLAFSSNKMNSHFVSEGEKKSGHEEVYWYDRFEYQNQIFKSLSGLDENIFSPMEIISVTPYNLTYSEDEYGFRKYTSSGTSGSITIKFKYNGPINDHINFYFDEKNQRDANYFFDNVYIASSSYWHKGICGLPIEDNDEHTLRISLSKDINNQEIRPCLYSEDINILENHLSIIKLDSLSLEKKRNYYSYGLEGKFTYAGGNKDLIFTIPNEDNIKVYIDNKLVSSYTKMNIFTAFDLSNIANGEHKIKIVYKDNVYLVASIISPLILLGTTYYCLFYKLDPEIYKVLFRRKKESSL